MKERTRIQPMMLSAVILLLILFLMMSVKVHAGGGYSFPEDMISGDNGDGTVNAGATMKVHWNYTGLLEKLPDFSLDYLSGDVKANWGIGTTPGSSDKIVEAKMDGDYFTVTVSSSDVGKYYTFFLDGQTEETNYNNNSASYKVVAAPSSGGGNGGGSGKSTLKISGDIVTKSGKMTIKGTAATGKSFKALYVDNMYKKALSGSSFSYELNLKELEPGMHTMYAKLDDGTKVDLGRRFPVHIYDKPQIAGSEFQTYKNYLLYTPNHTGYNGGRFCLSIRKKGTSKWSSISPSAGVSGYTTLKLTGLKANTSYQVRAFYSVNSSVGGDSYWYSGDATGCYSKIITIKTGPKSKPPIKSIKISNAKLKKVHIPGKWYKGKWCKPYDVYETTFKVTVTMKKKPGSAGIYIGKKKVKGNKTKYSATFTESGKLKGKKIKVSVTTYGDGTYGAYSPSVTKKVKVK